MRDHKTEWMMAQLMKPHPLLKMIKKEAPMSEEVKPVLLGIEAWEALPDEKRTVLERLGGGYRPPPSAPLPPQKEEIPKQYPAFVFDPDRTCAECRGFPCLATEEWPEPLCDTHYAAARARPPRAVLSFDDGHREMRRNPISVATYRDVVHTDDDVLIRWFQFESEQRENGKLVMQFYRQIPRPVDALGRPLGGENYGIVYLGDAKGLPQSPAARAEALADMQRHAVRRPWWKRVLIWFRIAWALKRLP